LTLFFFSQKIDFLEKLFAFISLIFCHKQMTQSLNKASVFYFKTKNFIF
jgi:hypothetical protein